MVSTLQYCLHAIVVVAAYLAVLGCNQVLFHPGDRDFFFDNDIAYPRRTSTVSNTMLMVVGFIGPFGILWLGVLVFGGVELAIQRSLSLATTIVITETLTSIGKGTASRPRPDFLSRCFPDGAGLDSLPHPPVDEHGLPLSFVPSDCSGDKTVVTEGLKSWPSGHASISTAGMVWLAILLGQLAWELSQPAFGSALRRASLPWPYGGTLYQPWIWRALFGGELGGTRSSSNGSSGDGSPGGDGAGDGCGDACGGDRALRQDTIAGSGALHAGLGAVAAREDRVRRMRASDAGDSGSAGADAPSGTQGAEGQGTANDQGAGAGLGVGAGAGQRLIRAPGVTSGSAGEVLLWWDAVGTMPALRLCSGAGLARAGQVLCLCLALYVSASRVLDNKHRLSDIGTGAALGGVVAVAVAVWVAPVRAYPHSMPALHLGLGPGAAAGGRCCGAQQQQVVVGEEGGVGQVGTRMGGATPGDVVEAESGELEQVGLLDHGALGGRGVLLRVDGGVSSVASGASRRYVAQQQV